MEIALSLRDHVHCFWIEIPLIRLSRFRRVHKKGNKNVYKLSFTNENYIMNVGRVLLLNELICL